MCQKNTNFAVLEGGRNPCWDFNQKGLSSCAADIFGHLRLLSVRQTQLYIVMVFRLNVRQILVAAQIA